MKLRLRYPKLFRDSILFMLIETEPAVLEIILKRILAYFFKVLCKSTPNFPIKGTIEELLIKHLLVVFEEDLEAVGYTNCPIHLFFISKY